MGANLTWEQKFAALNALTRMHLCMRAPGDWYVSADGGLVEIVGDGICRSGGTFGVSPEYAVESYFEWATELKPGFRLRVSSGGNVTEVRWNGFMWVPYGR